MGLGLEPLKSFEVNKVIDYARFGRLLKNDKALFFMQMFLYFCVSFYLVSHISSISYLLSITSNFIFTEASINKKEIVDGVYFYFLSSSGRLPTYLETLFVLLVCILVLFFNYKFDFIPRPFKIWLNFVFLILMLSSVYFLLFGYAFPYTIDDFSILYAIAQVGIFTLIPFLFGFSIALFSFSWWVLIANFLTFILSLAYSFVFAAVRYALFLYILKNYSFLWMANMFFNFGPLLDMIYISGIYGFYLSIISKVAKKNLRYWKWLY